MARGHYRRDTTVPYSDPGSRHAAHPINRRVGRRRIA